MSTSFASAQPPDRPKDSARSFALALSPHTEQGAYQLKT
jgi:hypothetical protein